jgi:hypothetical protein
MHRDGYDLALAGFGIDMMAAFDTFQSPSVSFEQAASRHPGNGLETTKSRI